MEPGTAELQASRERLTVVIRIPLAILILAMSAGLLYLFPDSNFCVCCFVPVGLAYLTWFVGYGGRQKHRGVFSFLGPTFLMIGLVTACWIDDRIQQVKLSEARMNAANQLKQIALALRAYSNRHGSFPPAAVYGPDGTPLHSWRVLILPFLEEDALYDQFRLNEPWDSPHNQTLLARMPPTYSSARFTVAPDASMTFYQVFVGSGAAFEGKQGIRPGDFLDGMANTILVVEAREAVPWTKPVDLTFAQDQPLPDLGAPLRSRIGRVQYGINMPSMFCAAMADGSIRAYKVNLAPPLLCGWITRNGGEKLIED